MGDDIGVADVREWSAGLNEIAALIGPRFTIMSALAPTLQAFFTDRLIRQRHATDHTIAAYRDTMRLLLGYVTARTAVPPSRLDIDALDAPMIGDFLDHLEGERGNSVRTRNARLSAIHSLFRFAALAHPSTPTRSPGCSRSHLNGSTGH